MQIIEVHGVVVTAIQQAKSPLWWEGGFIQGNTGHRLIQVLQVFSLPADTACTLEC